MSTEQITNNAEGQAVNVDPLVIHNLQLRLQNAEAFIMGLCAIIGDTLPPSYNNSVQMMARDFFESSANLGAFKQTGFYGG